MLLAAQARRGALGATVPRNVEIGHARQTDLD
jgi:hypothetical protein